MASEGTPLVSAYAPASRYETFEQITRNWAWIGTFGLFNIAVGAACLVYPVFASQVVELALAYTLFVSAVFCFLAICFADEGSVVKLLTLGGVQLMISCVMFLHPYGVLTVLTFFVAVLYMSAGTFQIAVAKQNELTAARGLSFISGGLAIALSVIIIIGLPSSSWFTIGLLVGVNHINIGLSRLAVSFYGFQLSRIEGDYAQHASEVFPGWMV